MEPSRFTIWLDRNHPGLPHEVRLSTGRTEAKWEVKVYVRRVGECDRLNAVIDGWLARQNAAREFGRSKPSMFKGVAIE
jgi:hypothetical protein